MSRQTLHVNIWFGCETDSLDNTRTWKKRPKFWKTVGHARAIAGVRVYTDDKIYPYVDYGTRPHIIAPRRAKVLRFRSGYTAKTSPRVIGSHKGGAFGDYRFARRVHHPGTKAREFTFEIQKRRDGPFQRNIQAAIDKGLRKTRRMRG